MCDEFVCPLWRFFVCVSSCLFFVSHVCVVPVTELAAENRPVRNVEGRKKEKQLCGVKAIRVAIKTRPKEKISPWRTIDRLWGDIAGMGCGCASSALECAVDSACLS